MDRLLFMELIETYYQLKKKYADNKDKFVELYMQARQAGYTRKDVRRAFKTIDKLQGGKMKKEKMKKAMRFLMAVFGKEYWQKPLKQRLEKVKEIMEWDVIPKNAVNY